MVVLHGRRDYDNNYVQLAPDIPMYEEIFVDSNTNIEHQIEFLNVYHDMIVHDHYNNYDLINKKKIK